MYFFATCVYLRRNLRAVWPPNPSLYLRPLATTCRSVWPRLYMKTIRENCTKRAKRWKYVFDNVFKLKSSSWPCLFRIRVSGSLSCKTQINLATKWKWKTNLFKVVVEISTINIVVTRNSKNCLVSLFVDIDFFWKSCPLLINFQFKMVSLEKIFLNKSILSKN